MKRNIILYIYALAAGGAERVMATLATGLAARGHDVTLVTDFFALDFDALVGPDVRRVELGRHHGRAVLALARLLRRTRPDISISATGVSNLKHAIAATLAGRRRHAVMTFHGHIESEPGHLSWLGNALAPVLTRCVGRSVYVSDDLRAAFLARGAAKTHALRIYNPIAAPALAEAQRPAGAPPHIVSVGRLVALKGFATLIEAFALLGDPAARLTIVGEGPERAALEAEIRSRGLGDRVALPGWAADPSRFYAEADCFVLASQRESFANVVVEALAHGLPVVATDCGGPREILGEGRFGRLVPVGDAPAMAAAIRAALADPGDPALLRARAASFSPDVAMDAYEALIDDVVTARG